MSQHSQPIPVFLSVLVLFLSPPWFLPLSLSHHFFFWVSTSLSRAVNFRSWVLLCAAFLGFVSFRWALLVCVPFFFQLSCALDLHNACINELNIVHKERTGVRKSFIFSRCLISNLTVVPSKYKTASNYLVSATLTVREKLTDTWDVMVAANHALPWLFLASMCDWLRIRWHPRCMEVLLSTIQDCVC